jgi:putative transposase
VFNLIYEFKLKPTKAQTEKFDFWLEQCRKIYNYALAERKDWFKSRFCQINACSLRSEYIIPADAPRPTYASQCKNLTTARANIPALKVVGAATEQQTLKRLEKAFVSMWEQNHGFPRFKKPGKMRSFVFPTPNKVTVKGRHLNLPNIGLVKFIQSRDILSDAVIKQIQVVKKASGFYAQLTLAWAVDVPTAAPSGEVIGVDVGLTNFIATSTGSCVKRPKFFVDLQRQLKLLQQRVSRKPPGSNNWRKAQAKVAKLHEHIANTRKNFHWQIAHQLCDQAQTIFVEDLNLIGLSRAMLGKHCLDAGWGQFLQILEQCCFKRGVYFQKVDAKKTSQICPNCGIVTGKKELALRVHQCPDCGYTTDRDVAAAQVVLQRGLAAVGYTVKMLAEGKYIGIPVMQESPRL